MSLHFFAWEHGWHIAGWTMVYFLALGTLVTLLAAPLRWILRRANPTVRYVASLAVFAALALLPLGTALWLSQTPASELPVALLAPAPQVVDLAITPLETGSPAAEFQAPAAPETAWTVARAIVYLPWVWLAGTPLTFLLLATGLVGAERLRRASRTVVEGPVHEAAERLRAALGVGRKVTVAICDRLATPLMVGIVRPLILLPPAVLTGWSADQLEMVLLHELAHVRRWDNLVNLLQRIVESLLFFHPAVWIVSRWVRRDREDCCDAVVVAHTAKPQAYAELLVALASTSHPLAGLAMAHHPLAGRIRRILHLEDETMLVPRNTLVAICTALLAVVFAVSFYSPRETDAEEAGRLTTEDTESTEDIYLAPEASRVVSDPGTADKPSPFPTLEEQRAADVAYKVLGVEMEELTTEELARVKAQGYQGGLRLTTSSDALDASVVRNSLPLNKDDLLVGLHVWPTESLKQLNEILLRPDLDQLSPLKVYVLKRLSNRSKNGNVESGYNLYSGRIPIDVPAWRSLKLQKQAEISRQDVGQEEIPIERARSSLAREKLETLHRQLQDELSEQMDKFETLSKELGASNSASTTAVLSMLANEVRLIQKQIIDKKKELLDIEVMKTLANQKANSPSALDAAVEQEMTRDAKLRRFQAEQNAVIQQMTQLRANTDRKNLLEVKRLEEHLGTLEQQMQEYRLTKESELRERFKSAPNDALEEVMIEYKLRRKSAETELAELQEQYEEKMEKVRRKGQTSGPLAILESQIVQLQEVERAMGLKLRSWDMEQLLRDDKKWQETRRETSDANLTPRWSISPRATSSPLPLQGLAPPSAPSPRKPPEQSVLTKYELSLTVLYDGKTFDQWRHLWKTELRTENRIECIKALAAFGRAGKGKEAAETILEIVKQYDWHRISSGSPLGRLKMAAIEALGGEDHGQGVEAIPTDDWLPVLTREVRAGNKRIIKFAAYVYPQAWFNVVLKSDEEAVQRMNQALKDMGPIAVPYLLPHLLRSEVKSTAWKSPQGKFETRETEFNMAAADVLRQITGSDEAAIKYLESLLGEVTPRPVMGGEKQQAKLMLKRLQSRQER